MTECKFKAGNVVRCKTNGIEGLILAVEGHVAGNQQYLVSLDIGGTNVLPEDSLELVE